MSRWPCSAGRNRSSGAAWSCSSSCERTASHDQVHQPREAGRALIVPAPRGTAEDTDAAARRARSPDRRCVGADAPRLASTGGTADRRGHRWRWQKRPHVHRVGRACTGTVGGRRRHGHSESAQHASGPLPVVRSARPHPRRLPRAARVLALRSGGRGLLSSPRDPDHRGEVVELGRRRRRTHRGGRRTPRSAGRVRSGTSGPLPTSNVAASTPPSWPPRPATPPAAWPFNCGAATRPVSAWPTPQRSSLASCPRSPTGRAVG